MYAGPAQAERTRWEVLHVEDKRVVRVEYGADFASALAAYTAGVVEGKRAVTLRCMNAQFPPPDSLADREEVVVVRNNKRYKGKRLIEPRQYRERMAEKNLTGWWWCGYCAKLRKFKHRKGYYEKGTTRWIPDPHMACPMCNVSHRLMAKYNPHAARLIAQPSKTIADPNRLDKRKAARAERRRARKALDAEA